MFRKCLWIIFDNEASICVVLFKSSKKRTTLCDVFRACFVICRAPNTKKKVKINILVKWLDLVTLKLLSLKVPIVSEACCLWSPRLHICSCNIRKIYITIMLTRIPVECFNKKNRYSGLYGSSTRHFSGPLANLILILHTLLPECWS